MGMKRPLGDDERRFPYREVKRPLSFSRVVVEVVRQQATQEFLAQFEPTLRRVVRDEVERLCQLYTSFPARICPKESETSHSRRWQLHFRSALPNTLFTSSRVETQDGSPLEIAIVDASSKRTVTSGPLSSLKVEILVVDGDFCKDAEEDWTAEEFDSNIVRERKDKRPLLMGELKITLKDGIGTLGAVSFTDNSSWIKSRRFRIGAKAIKNSFFEDGIREARSEAFIVKDHRGESYKKNYPPSWDDDIWRLEKIGKDGVYHQRLSDGGIKTVQDFLRFYVIDHLGLRSKFCSGMSNKSWETTVRHAKSCVLDTKRYVYGNSTVQLLLNSIFEATGIVLDGQVYLSHDNLSTDQMGLLLCLKQNAYKNPKDIQPLDALPSTPTASLLALNCGLVLGPSPADRDGGIPKDLRLHMDQQDGDLTANTPQLNDIAAMPVYSPLDSWGMLQGNSFNSRILMEQAQEKFGNGWAQTLNWTELFEGSLDITDSSSLSSIPGISVQIPGKTGKGWFKLRTALKWGISLRKDVAGRRMANLVQWGY